MPPRGVDKGSKRARQYEHIKDSLLERGSSEDKAEEIAARTVNKERARHGEAEESSRLSREDISSGRRGGLRSHRKGPRGRTRDQLYEEARRKNVEGRSKMNKAELWPRTAAASTNFAASEDFPVPAAPTMSVLVPRSMPPPSNESISTMPLASIPDSVETRRSLAISRG